MAFANPVVFAFSASVQFEQVAGDHDQWDAQDKHHVAKLARQLAAEVQRCGQLSGIATRTARLEICLLAVPVGVIEAASGRDGLSVVLGVAVTRKPLVPVGFYAQVLDSLREALSVSFPDRTEDGLTGLATRLTHCMQSSDSNAVWEALGKRVASYAKCFTFLMNGYDEKLGGRGYNDIDDPTAILGVMLVQQLHRSGHDQTGHLIPLNAFSDSLTPKGRITDHMLTEEGLYVCQSAQLMADEPASKPSPWSRFRSMWAG